jgi:hypothetical protein
MANGAPTLWGASEMMGSFFGGLAPLPQTFFVALCLNTAPHPFVQGGELDEPEEEFGYVRLEVPNTSVNWNREMETISNATDFIFTAATTDWGLVNYWAICDAPTEGNVYFYGEFIEPQDILATDIPTITAGTLTFVMGPIFTSGFDGT